MNESADAERERREIASAAAREALAWQRSGLAMAVIALVLVRRLRPIERDRPGIAAAIFVLATVCAVVGLVFRLSQRRSEIPRRELVLGVTLATMLTGVIAIAIVLVNRPI
jgi:hypothetical protein